MFRAAQTALTIGCALLLVGQPSYAKDKKAEFQKVAEKGKIDKMVTHLNQKLYTKPLKAANLMPKKVGLISVMIWDFGKFEYSAFAQRYGGTYMKTSGLSDVGGNYFATRFAEESVDDMKAAFQAHGMELLTPTEFADTDEKANIYRQFDLPLGGLNKAVMAIADFYQKSPDMAASAVSYQPIPAHLFPIDVKSRKALEELRVAMDLDAVVVVCSETRSSETFFGVANMQMYMWGHNPVEIKHKAEKLTWAPLVPYAHSKFGDKGFEGSWVATMKKGKIVAESYVGYGEIVGVMADTMLTKFEEDYAAGK